jgi:hypothetical protein
MSLDVEFQDKCESKTFITVDFESVQDLIDKYFKNERHEDGYEIPSSEDKDNGDSWELTVKPEDFSSYCKSKLDEIENGEWPICFTEDMLNHLCFKGIIKEGKYLIDIWW